MNTKTKKSLDISKALKNLKTAQLYEKALVRGEAKLSDKGVLVAYSGKKTGRSANDKFIVKNKDTENTIEWGKINKPISEDIFDQLRDEVITYLESREELFVQETIAGADPKNSVNIEVITETAFHSLFIRNMLSAKNSHSASLSYSKEQLEGYSAEFRILHAPRFKADTEKYPDLNSETFILVNYSSKEVLIAGTLYAGEIKKSAFAILNYIYPQRNIMPMHCSANTNSQGEVSIFFGLSGTGKTTLSADPERILIGDDEHGWSDEGVFNFEDGCYAKTIGLTAKTEPEIYKASRKFGTTAENVWMNDDRSFDYFNKELTENGRISYPLMFIPNAKMDRFVRKQPKNIIMLTCDAFGVLPAVSKLSAKEASEHFMLGYTAKIPGTEIGVQEPTAVFSPCFGAPFMPLSAKVYGELLAKKISENNVDCWLVNTGWAGGSYGIGKRMRISLTRDIIHGINCGSLAKEKTIKHPILGLEVPESIEMPENSWSDKAEYEKTAKKLISIFEENKSH
jgi:phosphoenolpyruvate carboxykinase (ATP)